MSMTLCIFSYEFLFLLDKFYAYWCRHVKDTANDKVGRFV